MTKKLILMRHGEAEIGAGYQQDFERQLTTSGILKLERLNMVLVERLFQIDLLLISPSQRTLETAKIITKDLNIGAQQTEASIYESSVDNLLDLINKLPEQYQEVMVVGHNPSLTSLLAYLTGDFNLSLLPGMMAILSFDLPEWELLSKGTGQLNEVLQ
ncbi:MAG TPA: histidine phosphatase family protein [Cyclobacteriaceae bacterium]|nr:histidine phosphatase family protein [Cyclobacteriaceae bacterium]